MRFLFILFSYSLNISKCKNFPYNIIHTNIYYHSTIYVDLKIICTKVLLNLIHSFYKCIIDSKTKSLYFCCRKSQIWYHNCFTTGSISCPYTIGAVFKYITLFWSAFYFLGCKKKDVRCRFSILYFCSTYNCLKIISDSRNFKIAFYQSF